MEALILFLKVVGVLCLAVGFVWVLLRLRCLIKGHEEEGPIPICGGVTLEVVCKKCGRRRYLAPL